VLTLKKIAVKVNKTMLHDGKFFATGGSHVCSDDFLKAEAVRCREDQVKEFVVGKIK
jgi:hypothetical protein